MRKLITAVLLLSAVRMSAQESAGESAALPFLNQIRSVKTAGTAGIYGMAGSDFNMHFGNVAGASFMEDAAMAGVSYSLWQPDAADADIFSAGGAYRVSDRITVTAGISSSLYRKEGKYDEFGLRTAEILPVDMLAGAGVAYRFMDCLSAGAAFNYVMSKNISGTLNAFSADVQLAFRKKGWKASVAACNLGPKVKGSDGAGWQLPMNARLNAGYEFDFRKSAFCLSAQGQYYFGGPSAVSGGVALEYVWNRLLSVRMGYDNGSRKNGVPTCAAAGAGIRLGGFSIDLAYSAMASGPMKNTLACGVGYSF